MQLGQLPKAVKINLLLFIGAMMASTIGPFLTQMEAEAMIARSLVDQVARMGNFGWILTSSGIFVQSITVLNIVYFLVRSLDEKSEINQGMN